MKKIMILMLSITAMTAYGPHTKRQKSPTRDPYKYGPLCVGDIARKNREVVNPLVPCEKKNAACLPKKSDVDQEETKAKLEQLKKESSERLAALQKILNTRKK